MGYEAALNRLSPAIELSQRLSAQAFYVRRGTDGYHFVHEYNISV